MRAKNKGDLVFDNLDQNLVHIIKPELVGPFGDCGSGQSLTPRTERMRTKRDLGRPRMESTNWRKKKKV